MHVVFMRQSHYWHEDPDLRPLIYRFEPIRGRDAAMSFLTGPNDPFPTIVGVIDNDTPLGEWLEAGAEIGFQELWECVGSGMGQWQRAKDIKRAYETAHVIRECIANPSLHATKKVRL